MTSEQAAAMRKKRYASMIDQLRYIGEVSFKASDYIVGLSEDEDSSDLGILGQAITDLRFRAGQVDWHISVIKGEIQGVLNEPFVQS